MSFQIRRLRDEAPPSPVSTLLRRVMKFRIPALLVWKHAKEDKAKKEAGFRWKRLAVIAVAVLCAFLLVGGTVKALIEMKILGIEELIDVAGVPLPKDEHGYTNLLLLGQGDETHDGIDLTDTLIIASIDPATQSVSMVSIPRDLYLRTSRMGAGRVNGLYRDFKYYLMQRENLTVDEAERAAMQELSTEFSNTFGVEIHRTIKVDFIGFIQAVDALGGVDIVVPEDLYDTQYPSENYGYQTFSILAGPQHLDGETALKYARSRHSTSDFDRSRRQQQIIHALVEKAKNDGTLTNPSRITALLRIMQEHVATTLTFREMVSLAKMGMNVNRDNLIAAQLNLDGAGEGGFLYPPPRDQFGGAAVLIPNSWDELRTFIKLLTTERELFLDDSTIDVLNAGAPSGSSRLVGFELMRYTLNTDKMENYEGPERETSAILAPAGHEETARTLANLLQIQDVAALPETSTGTSIQILLGQDYLYRSLATLNAEPEQTSTSADASADLQP